MYMSLEQYDWSEFVRTQRLQSIINGAVNKVERNNDSFQVVNHRLLATIQMANKSPHFIFS